jgi:hypothetical protein
MGIGKMDNKDTNGESSNIHRPEFVILDKGEPESEDVLSQATQNQYFQALKMLQKIKPFSGLRLIILFSILLVSVAVLIVTFFFLLNVIISALALFQNANLNKYLSLSWKNVKKVFAFWAGVVVGLFSPSLGLGLVILYFMQEGEPLNKAVLSRLFKSKFPN